ncbi:glycerate kinase [Propionibacterium australiense]|uniref:Glycerate 3-kinase n=1 Tax=Propionibacterium australiense TaxID=119981 RepID=A0A383S6R1_9ACTN|nr:glycerate kinase [Propionibacterium australiense]RLP08151.1 glycerate kinase [Propionibacterium australiense]RLP08320.1 glycerate kinase [Propionibacterium australiense]SYZ33059.1 glycerate 3-kinase [Propionibacterium australiense]VEH89038.1 Glycerate kinase [Propionibacterium australiense]
MSRYVLAPDSFKESLTSVEAAEAMAAGVRDADPCAETVLCPLAVDDEGFAQTLAAALGAEPIDVPVHDAMGEPVAGVIHRIGDTVILDAACACGLERVEPARRDVLAADSFGVGELILAALDAGARRLVVALGGSASNDGGAGMMAALGVRFLDTRGEPVETSPTGLARLASLDVSGLDPRLADLEVEAASEISAPLLGAHGASAVFGPQRGAAPQHVALLDTLLTRLSALSGTRGVSISSAPGAGAAGGLGWAVLTFLNGRMRSGAELVIEAGGLHSVLPGATAVLTGEGTVDARSLTSATTAGITAAADGPGVPVVVFAGRILDGARVLLDRGVTELVTITPEDAPLDEALASGGQNLRTAVAAWVRSRS